MSRYGRTGSGRRGPSLFERITGEHDDDRTDSGRDRRPTLPRRYSDSDEDGDHLPETSGMPPGLRATMFCSNQAYRRHHIETINSLIEQITGRNCTFCTTIKSTDTDMNKDDLDETFFGFGSARGRGTQVNNGGNDRPSVEDMAYIYERDVRYGSWRKQWSAIV